jgi:hypothetical protein
MKNLKGIKKNITKEKIEMVGNPNSLDIRLQLELGQHGINVWEE